MKRFFCKLCGRVRRARQTPHNVKQADSPTPRERVGVCKLHPAGAQAVNVRPPRWVTR